MDLNSDAERRAGERPESLTGPAELRRHLEQARVLRAEATAAMLAADSRALARPLRRLASRPARWWRQRATAAALLRCSDRVLADIGIEREAIPLVARGLDPSLQAVEANPAWRRWPAMLAHLKVLAMIRRGAGHGWLGHHPQSLADRA
jgi:uncharacterized protein YjiS (DUF1127 family)